MSEGTKAVFLSYASQDSEAAKRIADALRRAGVEVWFDQSELVGGDAWDAKIRKQIKECALLIPIISAGTNARAEGYFRLEWRLADQRTHLMGRNKAFLLPVTIDGTTDADADVPDSFAAVQWTKAPGGEVPPPFVGRVQKLLSGEQGAKSKELLTENREPRTINPAPRGRLGWVIAGVAAVLLAGALAQKFLQRDRPAMVVAPQSEAQKLLAQANAVLEGGDDLNRENFRLAEDLLNRAQAADPADAEVLAAQARLSDDFMNNGYDRTSTRLETMRVQAERAIKLAPDSDQARLAYALYLGRVGWLAGQDSAAGRESGQMLRALVAKSPGNKAYHRALAFWLIDDPATRAEAYAEWQRAHALPGGDAVAMAQAATNRVFDGDFQEAERAVAASLAIRPLARALITDVVIKFCWRGDLDGAVAAMQRWPSWLFQEDRGAYVAWTVWMWRHEPAKALAAIRLANREILNDTMYRGPRALLEALALEALDRSDAARLSWAEAVPLVETMTGHGELQQRLRVFVRAKTGDTAGAESALRVLVQSWREGQYEARGIGSFGPFSVADYRELITGPTLESYPLFERLARGEGIRKSKVPRAALLLNPDFAVWRKDSRFAALVAAAPAPDGFEDAPSGDSAVAKARADAAGQASLPDAKSVAVLAFANLSDDKNNEYFSDGISEELLNVLAKVPGLKVSARTSAFYFKGKDTPIPEIARQLGVAYVVEGSVRKAGDKVRITAQLIKAADGFHVWSDTFTRDLKDVFAVQDEIAGLIAQNLSLKLGMTGERAATSPEAFGLFLQGRFLARQESNTGRKESIDLYRRAIAVDPGFALAWAEMAQAYIKLARFGGMPTKEGVREARRAAEKALALDPEQPLALVALGWVQRTADWDWKAAQKSFERALALAPENAAILSDASILYFNVNRVEEALALARKAADRDPLNAMVHINYGDLLIATGHARESIAPLNLGLKLAPAVEEFWTHLAIALAQLQRFPEADAALAQEPSESYRLWARGIIAGLRGDRAGVNRAREALVARNDPTMVGYAAMLWIAEGRTDEAFEWLDRSARERDSTVCWVKNTFFYEPVRKDPRWAAFLRKVGLADDQLK